VHATAAGVWVLAFLFFSVPVFPFLLYLYFLFSFFGTAGVWVSNWAGELFDFHMNVKVTTLNYVFINL
jgi:hypothetical protein